MNTKRLLAGSLLLLAMATGLRAGQKFMAEPGEATRTGQYIVKFKEGTTNPGAVLNAANPAIRVLRPSALNNVQIIQLPEVSNSALVDRIAADPNVLWIEPNRIRKSQITKANDPSYASQWALSTIDAYRAWSLLPGTYLTAATVGNARIKVAVLDTGLDCTHAEFRNGGASQSSAAGGQISPLSKAFAPTNQANAPCLYQDDHGHGTHVAGTIGASTHNATGVASLGYALELIIFKVLDAGGSGDDATISGAIVAAADAGARIISMSLGGPGYSQSMQEALRYAWERDVLVVAAAGNFNTASLFFPAASNFAFAVAATDSTNARASFSNFGNSIGVSAPGVSILSTFPSYNLGSGTTSYSQMSGTSMATPHVSALSGLLASATPGLSTTGIVQQIQRSASSSQAGGGWGQMLGYGIINAHKALVGDFRPAAYGSVYGQVTDASGTALSGVTVSTGSVSVTTSSSGLFRLPNLAPGNHIVTASGTSFLTATRSTVVVAGADTPVSILMGVTGMGTVSGTVTGASGPVAGATVQILKGNLVQQVAVTNSAGQYSETVAPGTYSLRASAFEHSVATASNIVVGSNATVSRNLVLNPFGVVTGLVRDASGNAVSDAQITVQGEGIRVGGVSDAAGRYTALAVPEGIYTVAVSAGQFGVKVQENVSVSAGIPATVNFTVSGEAFSLSPAIAVANAAGTVAFVSVAGGTGGQGSELTWSLSPQIGTISSTGLYTAPSSLTASTVTVTATSPSGTSASATVMVNGKITLTLGNTSVVGGNAINNSRVTLSSPAPSDGLTIALTSSNPSVSSPQATLIIPPGATGATFAIPTSAAEATTSVTFTASVASISSSATASILAPQLLGVSLGNSEIVSGQTLVANSVWLTGPAPAGGTRIALASSDPAVIVPATVIVPGGTNSTPLFNITTNGVQGNRNVTITATLGEQSESASFLLKSGQVSVGLTLATGSTGAGTVVSGNTVTSTSAAPSGGLAVQLLSSNPSAASVPATLTIPAGSNSVSFSITTKDVAATTNVTISATINGSSASRILTITPEGITSLTLSANSVTGPATIPNNRVTLQTAASGNAVVTLSSSHPSVVVPASIIVAAGQTSSASFEIEVQAVTAVVNATITASYAGTSRSATLTVQPAAALSSLTVPTSIVGGAGGQTGQVALAAAAPAGGAAITFTSSNPSILPAPASLIIPAGQTTANFNLASQATDSSVAVALTATYLESSRTRTITVRPAISLSSFSIGSHTVAGGNMLPIRVTLDSAAPSEGAIVVFTSSHPDVVPAPPPATIPAGQNTTGFYNVPSYAVKNLVNVTLTASYNGVIKSDGLEIRPVALNSMVASPRSTAGGSYTSANRVTLDAPAPAGGILVTFSSSHPSVVAAPPAILVAPGKTTSDYFQLVTKPVASLTTVTLTATADGVSKTDNLEVRPLSLYSMVVASSSVAGGTVSINNRVMIDAPAPPSGVLVSFTSSHPAIIEAPAPVMIPSGEVISPYFSMPTAPVESPVVVTITAILNGVTKSDTITVRTAALASLYLSPNTVVGGQAVKSARIMIDSPAPAGGLVVTFSSGNPSVVPVPAPIVIPAGQTQVYFEIPTNAVSATTVVPISATGNGIVKIYNLTVVPPAS